jgi:hypothetical protein
MSLHIAQGRIGLAAALALAAMIGSPAAQAQVAQQVAKDPATGQIVAPTAAQSRSLTATRAVAPRGLITGKISPQPIQHANGTVEQELDESSLQYTVVVRNADGKLETDCVTGQEAADAIIQSKKVTKAAKERNYETK